MHTENVPCYNTHLHYVYMYIVDIMHTRQNGAAKVYGAKLSDGGAAVQLGDHVRVLVHLYTKWRFVYVGRVGKCKRGYLFTVPL